MPWCSGISGGRICPRCGRSDRGFVGVLCSDCYVEVYGVASVPRSLDFTYCKICGSYKLQGQWVEGSGGLEDTVKEYVYILLSQKLKPTTFIEEAWVERVEVLGGMLKDVVDVRVLLAGSLGSTQVKELKVVRVKINAVVCPLCTKRASKTGHNAVVQIRPLIGSLGEDVRLVLEDLLSRLEVRARSSIISVERVRNGFDILVEDQGVARIIAGKVKAVFGGHVIETFKVTGARRGGGRKGILTIAVRIYNIKPGDVIAFSGAPHIVVGGDQHRLRLVNMSTGDLAIVNYEDLAGAELLDAKEYAGSVLRRLQLSRVEGGNLVFEDIATGGEYAIPMEGVRILRGDLELGGVYLAYLLGSRLYLIGGSRFE